MRADVELEMLVESAGIAGRLPDDAARGALGSGRPRLRRRPRSTVVRVTRHFRASVAHVFGAWLDAGTADLECPLLQRDVRRRPGREHREVVGQVLARRDAVGRPVLAPPAKSARDDVHDAASPATVSGKPSTSPTGAREPSSPTDQP